MAAFTAPGAARDFTGDEVKHCPMSGWQA